MRCSDWAEVVACRALATTWVWTCHNRAKIERESVENQGVVASVRSGCGVRARPPGNRRRAATQRAHAIGPWWRGAGTFRPMTMTNASLLTRTHDVGVSVEDPGAYEPPEVREIQADEVSNGVVPIVYVSVRDGGSVGRSSLWIEHNERMRIRWHQGTPLPAE